MMVPIRPLGLLVAAGLGALAAAKPCPTCTSASAVQRKEYGSLSFVERLTFIAAVKCVIGKPSQLHRTVPAAQNRFDDYAAIHVNMTTSIHLDGIFLAWHRHFLYLMEQDLHACGWPQNLGVPYWNWPLYSVLETSPIFDGSLTSLGGNGVYDPNSPVATTPSGALLPHGTGGGCVKTGPFGNRTVNFQDIPFNDIFTGLPANWTQPDPHCMTRDLSDYGVTTFLNQANINAVLASQTVGDFNNNINGNGNDNPGLHGGGHYAIGGTAYNFFTSPQDPAFFLHHSMIDKVWADWQAAKPAKRRYVYNGTSTIFNQPTTPDVTNHTLLNYSVFGSITIDQAQDPMANIYCYKYV